MAKNDTSIQKFMAEQQKLADAAGMNILEYLAQAEGGILRETIAKIVGHERAHANGCPADCAFEASIKRLKEKHSSA